MGKKLILVALLWFVIIFGFIGSKQMVIYTGKEVILKVEPVDPRDIFRGDYVALSYDINRIELEEGSEYFHVGDTIYSILKKDNHYHVIDYVSKSLPQNNEMFIKGNIKQIDSEYDYSTKTSKKVLNTTYGIESYFVPEGKGKSIERSISTKQLAVLVSVDKYGNSVIKKLINLGKKKSLVIDKSATQK